MKVKIWGVRGSIPTPGEATLKYGGNTPCVQVEVAPEPGVEKGTLVIFDAGTGIRVLGEKLLDQFPNGQPLDIYLFLTHLHWDHIQGLPFFSLMYRRDTRVRLYGPDYDNLERLLRNQMHSNYFPVSMDHDDIKAQFEFLPLGDPLRVGGVSIRHRYVNHGPQGTVAGFRADSPTGSFVYIPDSEPYDYEAGIGESSHPELREGEKALIEFVRNADVMIFDTMFTAEDYDRHKGWGHSPVDYALDIAAKAGVKRLGLFHYAPSRSDEEIDALTECYTKEGERRGVEIFASREGMVIDIVGENRGSGDV